MSTNDFWNLVDKYKKEKVDKLYGLNTSTPGITSTRGTTPETEKFWEKVEEYQSDSISEMYSQIAPYSTVKIDDDIAPVKEEDEGGLDFFQKSGVFSDGYDLGDVTKTILGTAGDAAFGLVKGVGKTVEGLADLLGYGVAGVADLFGGEEYAEGVRERAKIDVIEEYTKPTSDYLDRASVLGRTSDAVAEGIGQVALVAATGGAGAAAGLGTVGTTALTTGLMGVSSMGSGMSEAYKGGATDEEALTYGAIAGTADALTELIFGGMGKAVKATGLSVGLSSADDMLAKKVSSLFTNQIAKNLTEFGIKAGAEGFEEVLAGVAQGIGKKITYMDEEELATILADENLLEQFVVGAVTSGVYQSGVIPGTKQGSLIEANQTGRDFITGLTQNEQAVVDKEYENRLAEAEKDGKLAGKEKSKLYDKVVEDMDKGYISTDTIEEVLGGDSYKAYQDTVKNEDSLIEQEKSLAEESKKLEAMVWEKMTGEQQVRRDELRGMLPEIRQKIEDMKNTSTRDQLKTKLSEEVMNLAQGSRLMESYNEAGRRKQAFEADLSQYDAKQQEVIKKAVESGILNNTNRTHEFVDLVAKISADKGVLFDFTNNSKLKESGFALDGKTINGYVTKDGVTVNIQSAKALNSVVGHEITHVLEGTDLYTELQSAVVEYARSKGDYQSRYDALTKLYEGVEGANIDAELTADLVGDYLFTDSDFISKLSTEHRNVFQKIFDEVKYLLKVATAGSKEAQQLEKVKRAFEKAYRETKNTATDDGVKYSIRNDIVDVNGKEYDTVVELDKTVSKRTLSEPKRFMNYIVNNLVGLKIPVADSSGNVEIIEFAGEKETVRKNKKSHPVLGELAYTKGDTRKQVIVNAQEVIGESAYDPEYSSSDNEHGWLDKNGWESRKTYVLTQDGMLYEAYLKIAKAQDGRNILYAVNLDINKGIAVDQDATSKKAAVIAAMPSGVNVAQEDGSVKPKFSLSDASGRELSPAVQKRFANSKAVDENGNLKILYHGTPSGEFSIFDKTKGSVEGDFGSGFYFTDNESDVSEHYEGGGPDFDNKVARLAERIESEEDIDYEEAEKRAREELFKGSHKFEVYLNIENPAVVGRTMLFAGESYFEQYNEEDYDDYDDYVADVEQALADDIENIVWEVEKNVDVYSTEGLAEVLYEAYYEGGVGIEELKSKINDLYLEDNEGNLVGNEVTRQIIESLGYDGIIDPTVSGKWNMDMEEGTTHYIVFKPNQIKAITNQNPTDNPDIHRSLSAEGETPRKYGDYNVYGKDIALENEIAPVAEVVEENTVETTQEDAAPVEELFPDDVSIVEDEAEALDRFASLEDADAPQEVDNAPEDVADNVPLTKTLVAQIAKDVRSQLGLPANRVAEVRDLIARYSAEEFPSRAHLYAEIYDRFGTFTESYVDEELKGIKSLLRTYGIAVDENIKKDIADYGQLMRSNFGKVRFSKEGLPVDVAYMEFQDAMPGLFPESIDVPADQLLRIIEVANMDTTFSQEQYIDSDTLVEITDLIANSVSQFKQTRKETLANKHGRESFQSLMEDADQYVPPVKPNTSAPTRVEMMASPDDIAPVFDTESGQQALMPEPETEAEAPKRITRKQLHENIVDDITTTFREKGYEFTDVLKNAKDLSTFATVDNTPQRVMEKALGYKEGQILADMTVNKVAQNETEGIKWLNSFTDKKDGLLAKISKQYNIKPGSKESAAAQMYAEGFYVGENDAIIAYGDAELAKDFPDAKVQQNIKKLSRDPRIRMIYDETLAAINESRTRNAYPEIPRLDNYFLHFRAMEDTFSKMGLPFNPNDIRAKDLPTDLNGVTADLKPGQPYFASAMHRKGKRTSFDLLGGLEKYLTSAKNQIYHIDDIQTLRALRNYVAETYGQAHGLENLDTMSDEEAEQRIEEVYNSHLSTFAKFLNEEANVLAGKTSLIDRGLEGVIGRRGMTFLDTLNRQVGANMVGFNVSSSLTNFLAPVQAFAKTNKADFVKAMAQTAANKIASIAGKGDNFAEESPVMIRRKGAERFYRTPWQKMSDPGYVMMSLVDDISTEIIARTKYNEFTRKGMDSQQAHIEADKWTSRLMGDRSLGQQPQVYNSKTLGLITKFQLEVRNQLDSQFYDTIQEAKVSTEEIENKLLRNAKKAAKITSTFAQLAVMQHLFGKAFESVAGYNPAFDIIDVLIKTFGWDDEEDEEDTVLDNIEEGFLALLGDLPYTSTLTGGRIPIASALPVTELIKGVDQYGNEKSRWDTIKEAAPYYFLPGGYGQIKKTKAGLDMFSEEHPVAGSYTDSGNLRFPVEDTTWNRVQAGLFGQWASENARDYFDNERKPMQEKQIEEFLATGMEIGDYWDYREGLSKYDTLEEKADYIAGLDLPIGTKNILVNNLVDRKESINLADYDEYGGLEEMDFATKNPEKYEVAVAVGGYEQYKVFQEDMKGMKLAEKADYISRLNLTTEQKNLLINSETDRKEPIDMEGYENYSSFEEFEYAKKNPEKYAMAKAVGGYDSYTVYSDALGDIKADKDEWGESISGSRKPKVYSYIYSLDIPEIEQHILFKSQYPSTDDHNIEIIEYLNNRDDISYDEMVAILLDLDFKVSADGMVRW